MGHSTELCQDGAKHHLHPAPHTVGQLPTTRAAVLPVLDVCFIQKLIAITY